MPNRPTSKRRGRHALLAALLLGVSVGAVAADYAPLRPVIDCLDPGRVRSWSIDSDDAVLIDAGRRHYLIELARDCPEIGTHPLLGFVGHQPSGRICGDIGDQLVAHGAAHQQSVRCPIGQVTLLAPDEYAQRSARTTVADLGSERDGPNR